MSSSRTAAPPSPPSPPGSPGSALWPVRARKTSSRDDRRRASSPTAIPSRSSARTTAGISSGSFTGAVIVSPSIWVCGPAAPATSACTRARSSASTGRSSSTCPPTWDFNASGVPSAITRPLSITTMSSASTSASFRYCVVSRAVAPSATRPRSRSQSSPRLCGSRPVVGSSRKRMLGRPTRLAARSRRLRMPPENVFTARPAASVSWKRSSSSAALALASRRGSPSSRPMSSRFSAPVRFSSTAAYCPVSPTMARTIPASRTTSCPATWARPPSGWSSVAKILTAVVFPAPLGPSSPRTEPLRAPRSTPASASVSLNRLTRPSASIAYVMGHPLGLGGPRPGPTSPTTVTHATDIPRPGRFLTRSTARDGSHAAARSYSRNNGL